MAFSASNLSIELGFDLTNSPKDFNLTDNTDYSAETYSNVLGLLRALDPSGSQFYNNTNYASPDIDLGSSPSSAQLGSLPLDTNGLVKTGDYTFIYTVKVEDMLQTHTILSNDSGAKTFTINGNYATQILEATAANWECVDSVTTPLTIVSATYSSSTGLTTVTINETLGALTALAQFRWTVDVIYSQTFTQDYSYASPSICLNWVSDECCSSMTITDNTVYASGATVTRLHTVSYPIGISPAPADITSPLQELTITPIWTGTWVDIFTADITASNGIISITDSVRGVKDHKVSADEGLCQAYTCLSNMSTKYNQYLVSAPQAAAEMLKYIAQASAALWAYTIGKKCGRTDYQQYLDAIFSIASTCGCGCDCGDCADNVPTQIVGCCENVGGSDFTILIPSTSSVTVSSNTVGTTTTFTVSVNTGWLTSQINGVIATTSIDALADVNTGNIASQTGQVLTWNEGTGRWQRALPQNQLVNLTDVDDTGLANNMYLYYDAGSSTFKFKLLTAASIATLSDVTLTSLASGDILKYNGSAWVNVDNFLSLLGDVNTTGIVDGSALEWDTGTSKWIVYSPKKTLASLDDVDFPTSPIDGDRFRFVTGTGWTNVALPAFSYGLVSFNAGYGATVAGFHDFGYSFDPITDLITLRGAISNTNGAVAGPVTLCTLPVGFRPQQTIPFQCTVGGGLTNAIAIGEVQTDGDIVIYYYMDPANPSTGMISGIPAGAILIQSLIQYYSTI